MAHRTRIGRQKIEIRRIESQQARLVCFSKRRAGLFSKASELAILCGVEVASIIISPGKKVFSFGYPSVDAVIERFDPTRLAIGRGGGGAGGDNKLLADLGERELMEYAAALQEVQAAVAAYANQVLVDTLNHDRAMEAKSMMACSSNKNQVQPPRRQFLAMGAGGNGWFNFVGHFGGNISNSSINNGAEMEMQIQQMIMGMTPAPAPGFAGAGMEMLLQ